MKERKLPEKGKWSFLKDFQRNEKGEYVYVGKTYTYASEHITRFKAMRALFFLNLVMMACLLGCGLIRAAGIMHAISVLLPYAVAIVVCGVLIYKQIELWVSKEPLREYVYKATVLWYDVLIGITAAAQIIMLVTETVFVGKNGFEGYVGGTILLYVFLVLSLAAGFLQFRFFKTLKWNENPSSEEELKTE